MAGQSLVFDFLSRGAPELAGNFRRVADNTVLAAKGARVLGDVIGRLGSKENRTAAESVTLAKALRLTGDAEDRVAARAVLADAAIRRLDDAMQDSAKSSGGLRKALGGLKLNPGLVGPALLLAPAMTTLAGAAAGAGVALGGAFIAGGGALAAFGSVAKPVLTDAKKAAQAVEKAQNNYSIAIANGTKQSVAYKAEQVAIGKAYAGMSPAQIALSRQLGGMASAWDKVKAAQTPVVAGALQPWLRSVTGLTSALGPIIAKIAPVIASLGGQFNSLVNSAAFRGFRDFIGSTGAAAVSAGGSTIIDLVKSFMILLPKFDPLIREAVGWIARLGPAVLKWSESKKASDDITKFMQWFSRNGPVVGGLLKNIGGALAALAPGLASGATLELKIISDFLGWVAKLPPSVAKPLAEVAGAALILSKMGGGKVISFLVTGTLGGIFGKGGVAAAGGAAEAGGAASLWSKLTPGARLAGGALAMTLVVDAVLKSTPSGPGGKNWFDNPFGMPGPKDKASANNWLTSWSPYISRFKTNITDMTGFVSGSWSKFTGFLSGSWSKTWSQITGRSAQGSKAVGDSLAAAGRSADSLRSRNLIPLRGEFGKVTGGIQGLAGTIQGTMLNALRAAGARSDAIRTRNLTPLRGELGKVTGGVQGLQGAIDRLHGKTVSVGVTGSGHGGVVITTSGLAAAGQGNVRFTSGKFAQGGRVPFSAGTPGRDSVLVMTKPGEIFIPPEKGPMLAPALKAAGIPGFASGGFAGMESALGSMAGTAAGLEGRGAAAAMAAGVKAAIAKEKAAMAKAAAAVGSSMPGGGGGAARWKNQILTALAMLGQPGSLLGAVERRMNQESGGNQFAVNKWDSNWAAGTPSVGVMQVIGPTYASNSPPGWRHLAPMAYGVSEDVLANTYAGLHHAITAYPGRSLASVMLQPGGYDSGGILPARSIGINTSPHPEVVLTKAQWTDLHRLLTEFVRDARHRREPAWLVRWVRGNDRQLSRLAAAHQQIAGRIAAAKGYAANTAGSLAQYAGLSGVIGATSPAPVQAQDIVSGLAQKLRNIRDFGSAITGLSRRGLSRALISQIIAMGPDDGLAYARAILDAPWSVRQLNVTQAAISRASGAGGRAAADAMYDTGRNAGRGFLTGLLSQQKQVDAAMRTLAGRMIASLRRALGIRSPSAVMAQVGEHSYAGYHLGWTRAMAKTIPVPPAPAGSPVPSAAGGGNTYNFTITLPPGSDAEQGRRIVSYIKSYESGSGPGWRR